jgi:outer membrane immunogenic protein
LRRHRCTPDIFFLSPPSSPPQALPPRRKRTAGTGFYVGGQIGYGFQPNDDDETIEFDTNLDGTFGDTVRTSTSADAFSPGFCGGTANGPSAGEGCRSDRDRPEYGAHVGFDYDMGNGFVVGVVGDYTRSRLRDSVSSFSTTPAATR